MKNLIRISGVLIIVFGLTASFFSLFPLVYFVHRDVAVNELSDFALKAADLHERYKKQLVKGTDFILETIYKNAMVSVCSWLFFLVTLVIKFCGVEILFLRELGRKLIIGASIVAILNGVIGSTFTLQLVSMMNALITVSTRDFDEYARLCNASVNQITFIALIWFIFNGLIIYWFTRPKVKEQFG